MKMVMEELNLSIPPYTDLQLWSNPEWLANFDRQWPFRSVNSFLIMFVMHLILSIIGHFRTVGDTSWYTGEL